MGQHEINRPGLARRFTKSGRSRRSAASLLILAAALAGTPAVFAAPAAAGENGQSRLASSAAAPLVWQTSIPTAFQLARQSNKMVLIDVYTDWCGWCHKLDRDTYSNPAVIDFLNGSFVCLKIDAEDGGPGQSLAQRYRVRGFPCILMLDAAGNLRGVFYGYRNAEQFPQSVKKALEEGMSRS